MTKNEPCRRAMVLRTRKPVIFFQLEDPAVTCLKVPALSSDILTKVRELSQSQFHYKLHENTKNALFDTTNLQNRCVCTCRTAMQAMITS